VVVVELDDVVVEVAVVVVLGTVVLVVVGMDEVVHAESGTISHPWPLILQARM
jgi:hypothetical protein